MGKKRETERERGKARKRKTRKQEGKKKKKKDERETYKMIFSEKPMAALSEPAEKTRPARGALDGSI